MKQYILTALSIVYYSFLGIGEQIATRLDAAWKQACEKYFFCETPSLSQVRCLKKGEALPFLEKAFVAKGKRDAVPFLPRFNFSSPQKSPQKKKDDNLAEKPTKEYVRPPKVVISDSFDFLPNEFLVGSATLAEPSAMTSSFAASLDENTTELLW